jgi:outer membrane protein assembly factor BamB
MMVNSLSLERLLFVALTVALFSFGALAQTNWPNWRGPDLNGIAADATPPLTWSETENIKWKTALPGDGQTTPIIWGDRIFLQAAIPLTEETTDFDATRATRPVIGKYQFVVLCVDRTDGSILWQTPVCEAVPHQGHHPSTSLAPYSPVTDGERVWASFGSRGLYCLDFDGNVVWEHPLIQMDISGPFGEGSSPALADGAVFVVADHEGDSKIVAFEKDTGEIRFEKDRDEPSSWATPLPVTVDGRVEIVTSANNFVRSYDARTGDVIWRCAGLTDCASPTPVVWNGKVYCATGFRGNKLLAIALGREGDLTGTDAIVWSNEEAMSHVPTPLIYNGVFYSFAEYKNVLSAFDAETGEMVIEPQRISGLRQVYASPLGADGRIYVAGRRGTAVVLEAARTVNVLATNELDDVLDGSPVAIGDELYLRGRKNLYCIAE